MTALRARRWLVICSVAGWTACSADTASRRPVAPVAPVAAVVAASQPASPHSASSSLEAGAPTPTPTPPSPSSTAPVAPPSASSSDAPSDAPAVAATLPATDSAPTVEPSATTPPCPDDPGRDQRQKPDDVIRLVELSDAMTVVDLGSGDGYFLCRLSRAVGARGRVIGTEISQPLVRDLKKRAEREQLSNVEIIKAPANDVGVAPGSADRILLVNVWHHLPNRRRYATRVSRALSPGGKVVVIDFQPAAGGHGITPERVLAELAAGGIDGELVSEDLPNQYVIIGALRAQPGGPTKTSPPDSSSPSPSSRIRTRTY
jgi:predicted methyltransferase